MRPHVTAVVPTRNRLVLLGETLDAILGQRDADVTVVVVDEASSDGTPAFLAALAEADGRVEVVRNDPPLGVARARNVGLALVGTEWVAFCDDDDVWAPDKLAAQLGAVDAVAGAQWSCAGTVLVDPSRRVIGHQRPPASGDVRGAMRGENAVPGGGSGILARTELVRRVGGFDPWFVGCEDFELAVKLALEAPVAAVDRPLVGYRVAPGSMSGDVERMRTGHERVVERYEAALRPADGSAVHQRKESYLGEPLVRSGRRLAIARHFGVAAVRTRQARFLLTAAGGLLAPGELRRRHDRWAADAVPKAWRAEAEAWLSLAG